MSARRRPHLSIVSVAWNHADEIGEFLSATAAAIAQAGLRAEIIIVDNASRDGTADLIEQRFPGVLLIRNARNRGFAEGSNQGLAAATGRHLLLLNPDARPNGPALRALVRFLDRHPSVGAVGCALLHHDRMPQQSAFPRLSPCSYILNHSMIYPLFEEARKRLWRLGLRRRRPYRTGWLQGSCLAVPRRVYTDLGGLDPSYFIYCEDADWCERIRVAGHAVVHLPNIAMSHRQKGSVRRAPEFCFRRVYRSLLHFANLHRRGIEHAAFRAVMTADMAARLPAYALLAALRPSRRAALAERRASVRLLLRVLRNGDPDFLPDAPPR